MDHEEEALMVNVRVRVRVRDTKEGQKAFNVREVWNPMCCCGNKSVNLILWRTL